MAHLVPCTAQTQATDRQLPTECRAEESRFERDSIKVFNAQNSTNFASLHTVLDLLYSELNQALPSSYDAFYSFPIRKETCNL